jgi:hypothetical protein
MPVQCGLSIEEFQEEKMSGAYRTELLARCRPARCPSCGEYGRMHGHGFVRRYAIIPDGTTLTLLVPVYRCAQCGRHIRVLPHEMHNGCCHVARTIVSLLSHRIRTGHHKRCMVPRFLQHAWWTRFLMRVQDAALVMDNLQGALDSLPPFSLLYRKTYRSVYQDEPPPSRRASPRILPLVVCLGHG